MDTLDKYERSWGVRENDSFTYPNIDSFQKVAMNNVSFDQTMSPEVYTNDFRNTYQNW